jgi:hypothetical protein
LLSNPLLDDADNNPRLEAGRVPFGVNASELYYTDEHGTGYEPEKLHELVRLSRGNASKRPLYFLGMLAVPESLRFDTYRLVSNIKNRYLTPLTGTGYLHERSVESELKGSRLFHRIENRSYPHEIPLWQRLTPQMSTDLLNEFIDGLIRLGLSRSFYVTAVDQIALYRRYFRIARNAAFIALTFLQQRACSRLEFKYQRQLANVTAGTATAATFEHGAFIIDRGSAVEAQLDVFNFLSTRDQISQDMNIQADYDRWLLENPLSVISSDCPQLQICDVLLYICARAVEVYNYSWPWFQRVLPLIASRGNGTIEGVGFTFYPSGTAPPTFAGV